MQLIKIKLISYYFISYIFITIKLSKYNNKAFFNINHPTFLVNLIHLKLKSFDIGKVTDHLINMKLIYIWLHSVDIYNYDDVYEQDLDSYDKLFTTNGDSSKLPSMALWLKVVVLQLIMDTWNAFNDFDRMIVHGNCSNAAGSSYELVQHELFISFTSILSKLLKVK